MTVLDQILARGLTQHRDVTRYFAQRAQAARGRLLPSPPMSCGFALNRAYHSRFQDLRRSFGRGTIKILAVDPPYVYARNGQGVSRPRSSRGLTCDNSSRAAALTTVIDLLREWQPTLAPGGVLLLWQPAQVLLREIDEAIERYKWAVESLVIWDKGRPQPGAFGSPYSPQDEHLLVLKRPGDSLLNHDNSYRGNILRFPPVSQPGLAHAQEHGFEKPLESCKFLIGKHSFEGELVVDLCGCTGAMSLAAIEINRRWVYVESNLANYQIGAGRLAERLGRQHAEAS
jgi:DNA modification methylase